MLPICVTFCWTDSQLDNPWFNAHEITYILYCSNVQEKGYCNCVMSVLCGLSCGLIMSLKVLMLFVNKTSLELVYLKQQKKKNFKKKVVCLKRKFHVREKKKNYSRISFVLAWEALMSLFYCGLLDVFVFSKMWCFCFFF